VDQETLNAADRVIRAVLTFPDHARHNRPGVVLVDGSSPTGVRWHEATKRIEGETQAIFRRDKGRGRRVTETRLGVLAADGKTVRNGTRSPVGEWRTSGLFTEVVVWAYRQIAEIWKLDNEFVARWASYAFTEDHRDVKVLLAAFLLAQSRKGDPIREGNKILFHDENYRDVGEALMLATAPAGHFFNAKMVLSVREVLRVPAVAVVNRAFGFTQSDREAAGEVRWRYVARRWLRYRERNLPMLEGLVKSGWRRSVLDLASAAAYRPESPVFYRALRWEQDQAEDGRRRIAIGEKVAAAETWQGLDEQAVCERIAKGREGNWKRIVGLLPPEVGLTPAVAMAAIEAGALSDKEAIILAPTFEELGILHKPPVAALLERAAKTATDMRAASIATRVRGREAKEALTKVADTAAQKIVSEVTRDLAVYFLVDTSGSMEGTIERARAICSKMVACFPEGKLSVFTFTTGVKKLTLRHWSAAGVERAFAGVSAGGGTDYATATILAARSSPPPEGHDVLVIYAGDEEHGGIGGPGGPTFSAAVRDSGLRPMAFGLVRVTGPRSGGRGDSVRRTAAELGIPCFAVDEGVFSDPYAAPRAIRDLVSSTPVDRAAAFALGGRARETLAEKIAKTPILERPAWVAVTGAGR